MAVILIFIGHYLPGFRVGGPARSTSSMVRGVPSNRFLVFTSETDFGSTEPLEGVEVDAWQVRDGASVFYASQRARTVRGLIRAVRQVKPDLIYLNSFFARRFTIPILALRQASLIPRLPVVVAPHGEFSPGALALKRAKKRTYIRLAAATGLYRGVVWHAASNQEARDIRQVQGEDSPLVVAPNFPPAPRIDASAKHRRKEVGRCRLVFLSRISRKKNLFGAITALLRVREDVSLDIYGPLEDVGYWRRCEAVASQLPHNVRVAYKGEVVQGQSIDIFLMYDALLLPTLGENYGYVVPESWAAGTPVLISDRTPWSHLENDFSGWTTAPDNYDEFARIIDFLARMGDEEHARWRAGSLARANALAADASLRGRYADLFGRALSGKGGS